MPESDRWIPRSPIPEDLLPKVLGGDAQNRPNKRLLRAMPQPTSRTRRLSIGFGISHRHRHASTRRRARCHISTPLCIGDQLSAPAGSRFANSWWNVASVFSSSMLSSYHRRRHFNFDVIINYASAMVDMASLRAGATFAFRNERITKVVWVAKS